MLLRAMGLAMSEINELGVSERERYRVHDIHEFSLDCEYFTIYLQGVEEFRRTSLFYSLLRTDTAAALLARGRVRNKRSKWRIAVAHLVDAVEQMTLSALGRWRAGHGRRR